MTVLFHARLRERAITVGQATADEVNALARELHTASCRDVLDLWTLVAIRDNDDEHRTKIHALGWRVALHNSWITSRLVAIDEEGSAVATRSGHSYQLGQPDGPGVSSAHCEHLRYALVSWGFEDICR